MTLTAPIEAAAKITTARTRTLKNISKPNSDTVEMLSTPTPETAAPTVDSAAPERERFHITDRNGLEWYSRKMAQIRTERDSIKAQAEKMIRALDANEASLKGLYEEEAKATTAALLSAGGNRRKSIDTFFGTFGFRTVTGGYAITDTDAALPHAHALGCTKTTIATDAYLQAAQTKLEETGELLPGITKSDDRETFGLSLPRKKTGNTIQTDSETE